MSKHKCSSEFSCACGHSHAPQGFRADDAGLVKVSTPGKGLPDTIVARMDVTGWDSATKSEEGFTRKLILPDVKLGR